MFEGIFSSFSFEPFIELFEFCVSSGKLGIFHVKSHIYFQIWPSTKEMLESQFYAKQICAFPWDLSLSDLAAGRLKGLMYAGMMGLLWSGSLAPRHEVLKQGMLKLAQGVKGGNILNEYEHRLWR